MPGKATGGTERAGSFKGAEVAPTGSLEDEEDDVDSKSVVSKNKGSTCGESIMLGGFFFLPTLSSASL